MNRLRTIVVGLCGFAAMLTCWILYRHAKPSQVAPRTFSLAPKASAEWQPVGGSWIFEGNSVLSESNERGAKLLTGSTSWRNYTVSSDIRFDGASADMGVVVRSSEEARGVDAFDGYYVGLRSLDETLVIGRADYGWVEARPIVMPGGVRPAEWYRLRVTAYGCNIGASAQNLRTHETAWIAFKERSCLRSGRIGLRSLNVGAWRNVSVTGATAADYLSVQQHADSVEQPVVLNGPPWWTPIHGTLLFLTILGFALLLQLVYFRLQQWRTLAIVQDRERLAHEIHDTMAQSFAGVSFLLQGIRSNFIRGNEQDLKQIPEQLSTAYQLVRRCHQDVSSTVTTLGSAPEFQSDLLAALEQTAQRLVRDGIEIRVTKRGDEVDLRLFVADALLRIGQEAIANAIAHSAPSSLGITLSYSVNRVDLLIEDNGTGFASNSGSEGFGILSMQKRARAISGKLDIQSAPGQGTRVLVQVPLQKWPLRYRFRK